MRQGAIASCLFLWGSFLSKKFDKNEFDERILEILDTDLERRDMFLDKVDQLIAATEDPREVYQEIIYSLSHINLSLTDAEHIWKEVMEYRKIFSDKLERDISFRVALLDYLLDYRNYMENPRVIEMYIYENTRLNVMLDELTGIYNHRFLREYLWKETKRSLRYDKQFSLIIMDIDNFRDINDRYGKIAGDEILSKIGSALQENMRIEDVASRYSSDEFIIILPETDKAGALSFSSRVKRLVEALEVEYGTISLTVKVSMGVSTFHEDTDDPVELIELADKALYRAKFMGKNRIVAYDKKQFQV